MVKSKGKSKGIGVKSIVNVGLSVLGAGLAVVVITPMLSSGFSATGFEALIIVGVVAIGAFAGDFVSDNMVEKD